MVISSPWVKAVSWTVGGLVAFWAIIDAARGYWSMYQEYGPGIRIVLHHWWISSPWRASLSIAVIGASVLWLIFYLIASPPVPVKPAASADRELDLGEVANTTKFQEAFIIDMYNDVSASTYDKGEVYTMMTGLLEKNPSEFMAVSFQDEIQDLIQRGIVMQTKIAQRPEFIPMIGKIGTRMDNVFLTKKGKTLAEDLLYVRSHPELNVSRPAPPQREESNATKPPSESNSDEGTSRR